MSDDQPASYWVQVRRPGASRIVTIDRDTDVGRDADDGLLLDDPTVSRRHLRLGPTAMGLVVVDLGSANGTTIDGERLVEPRIVRPGNVVRLGETELVVFEGRDQPATGSTAAVTPPAGDADAAVERPSAGARRLLRTTRSPFKGTNRPPDARR
jgi:pSer/pThr/pTyr-binding forkhead associated (FHA) protein